MVLGVADARRIPLADESVQCVVTSPPYWGLRDYGLNGRGIGLEASADEYVAQIVAVFRQVRRVLRNDGTVWLNLGDSYAGSPGNGRGGERPEGGVPHRSGQDKMGGGLKPKDLVGIPWRVALALQADGWWLRSDIIWHKPSVMPESVTDRPTKAHEYVFLLAKSKRYYYDAEAVKEAITSGPSDVRKMVEKRDRIGGKHKAADDPMLMASSLTNIGRKRAVGSPNGRNKRSVWTIAAHAYKGAHFATFPVKLVEPMVLAGSAGGDVVLDPFGGTMTVGQVCAKHGRRFVGLDLKREYVEMGRERCATVQTAYAL